MAQRRTTTIIATVAAGAGLLLAGCGDDDDEGAGADAAEAVEGADGAALGEDAGAPGSADDVAATVDQDLGDDGAVLVLDGAAHELTTEYICETPDVSPPILRFRGHSADRSVTGSGELTTAAGGMFEATIDGDTYQVIVGVGDIDVDVHDDGGTLVGTASGTLERIDGSGAGPAFEVQAACSG